jgi:hypothetical protein
MWISKTAVGASRFVLPKHGDRVLLVDDQVA